MPVGNDVVDLRDPANQPSALHPRFDRRVFAEPELASLARCRDVRSAHELRWTMWAAKEAALKCLRQLDPATPFHPRGLIVALSSPRRATVGSADRSLRISLDRTPARVHAVARLAGATCATERAHVRQRPAGETETTGSRALRAWCSARIAEWLALDEDAVRLSPAGGSPLASGAPAATADGRPLPVELSLSHDGRWHGAVLRLSSVVQQLPA